MRLLLGVCILCAPGANRVCAQSGVVRGATAREPNAGCFRGMEGAEVPEPENLRSVDGVLKVELAFRSYVDANGNARYCYVTPSGGVSPTLRVNPGDTVLLNLKNEVPEEPARAGTLGSANHQGTMKMTAETGRIAWSMAKARSATRSGPFSFGRAQRTKVSSVDNPGMRSVIRVSSSRPPWCEERWAHTRSWC